MTRYKVITHAAREYFEKQVNAALAEGWELYGPLNVTMAEEEGDYGPVRAVPVYHQALVRPEAGGLHLARRGRVLTEMPVVYA